MKPFFAVLLLFTFSSFAVLAEDEERLTVVELFTSQGCSSCPPADAVLKGLRDRPNLLTLSWAVDYWDRLGWKDTFSSRAATNRQSAYNRRFKRRSNYTPQMVFDGRTQGVGSRRVAVHNALSKARNLERPHQIPGLKLDGSGVSLVLAADPAMKDITLRVVWFLGDAEVHIGRGENGGRVLDYTNVVLASDILGKWDGGTKSFQLRTENARKLGADHVAILLHSKGRHGPIVGAASLGF